MKTILAPIDFSESTESVIEGATELARSVSGRVVFIHVVQPPILTSDYGLALDSFQEAIRISERHAVKRLQEIEERVRLSFGNVVVEQIGGLAIQEILNAAERHQASYIVMGSHGHTAIYDLLVGSTTHGILRKVHCPVVIIPPVPHARGGARVR